jgi:hypothetical protein
LGLTVSEHRRKNTEDEPRGVVFKHDLIEEKWLEDQKLDETSLRFEETRLKGFTTRYGSVRLR